MTEITLDEVKRRLAVAGLTVSEDRLEMMRRLLADALAPLNAADFRALQGVEPAVAFDAGAREVSDGR